MALAEKPPGCEGCPAQYSGRGFVRPVGPPGATFLVIGSGPTEDDAYQGEPAFDGAFTGQSVTRRLYTAGLLRSEVILTDLVWCWMPNSKAKGAYKGSRPPTRTEIKHCWKAHLGPFLADLPPGDQPKHIITMGLPALRWFKGMKADDPAETHYGTTELHPLPELETP